MRKIFFIAIFLSINVLLSTHEVFAQTSTNSSKLQMKREEKLTQRLINLKTKANQEINRRITSLTTLIAKIDSVRYLTENQKSTLTLQVKTEIAALTILQSKIEATQQADELRNYVKSVVNTYNAHAVYMPKIQMLKAIDELSKISEKLAEVSQKLSDQITQTENKGENVIPLRLALLEMNNKLSDAKIQLTQAKSQTLSLTPTDYPSNKSSLKEIRNMLFTTRQDIKVARQEAKIIIESLRKF